MTIGRKKVDMSEETNVTEEFTSEEKAIINRLIADGFENITPEEVELYARWRSYWAVKNEEFVAFQKRLEQESQARIANEETLKNAAMANLEQMRLASIERLKAIENE